MLIGLTCQRTGSIALAQGAADLESPLAQDAKVSPQAAFFSHAFCCIASIAAAVSSLFLYFVGAFTRTISSQTALTTKVLASVGAALRNDLDRPGYTAKYFAATPANDPSG